MNSKTIQRQQIENEEILDLVTTLISCHKQDHLKFPLLSTKNESAEGNKIPQETVEIFDKFEDRINFLVFQLLFEHDWLSWVEVSNQNHLSLLFKSMIYQSECTQEIYYRPKIISYLQKVSNELFQFPTETQILFLFVIQELNKTQLSIFITVENSLKMNLFSPDCEPILQSAFLSYLNSILPYDQFYSIAVDKNPKG